MSSIMLCAAASAVSEDRCSERAIATDTVVWLRFVWMASRHAYLLLPFGKY
jgi:hypothetical protein